MSVGRQLSGLFEDECLFISLCQIQSPHGCSQTGIVDSWLDHAAYCLAGSQVGLADLLPQWAILQL